MNSERILVLTADSATRRDLRETLISESYVILEARSCGEALEEIETGRIDLVLLDVSRSEIDGLEACQTLRHASTLPIIVLGFPGTAGDRPRVVNSGADDYLVKPIAADQLIARMRAAFRPDPTASQTSQLESSCWKIDFACRRVIVNEQTIHLTPKELELLRHLVLNQGRPVSHVKLLEALWGSSDSHHINHLRVFVNQLRKKIEPHLSGPRHSHIQTDNFIGYHFEPNPEKRVNSRRAK